MWGHVRSQDGAVQQRDGGLLGHSGAVQGTLGRPGRYAGEFHWVHDLAIDSQGNLYAGEVDTGKRAQKFVRAP